MLLVPNRLAHPAAAAAWAGLLASLVVGVGLGLGLVSLRAVQIMIGLAVVCAFLALDNDAPMVPRILRPGVVLVGSLLISSASLAYLQPGEYERSYLPLWCLQVAGFVSAYLVFPRLNLFGRASHAPGVAVISLRRLSWVMFAICALAAAWYFKTVGIGALGGDLEQSRVDAAEGTSGYLRLIAFLLPVPAAMLVALDGLKRSAIAIVVAAAFIAGVGSRVPMLYFLLPLVVMAAVTGHRIGSAKIIAAGVAALVFLGLYGAFRVEGTQNIAALPMYRDDVARGDTIGVASTAVEHYAAIVPANAVLTKRLVDQDLIPFQWGQTYVTLFTSVLPGKQTSPDMLIRQKSGKSYIGGGTPPTLGGEGYMNFGYLGVFASAALLMLLVRYWEACAAAAIQSGDVLRARIDSLIYGFTLVWAVFANISGIAGSATITLASFIVLVALRQLTRREPITAPAA